MSRSASRRSDLDILGREGGGQDGEDCVLCEVADGVDEQECPQVVVARQGTHIDSTELVIDQPPEVTQSHSASLNTRTVTICWDGRTVTAGATTR